MTHAQAPAHSSPHSRPRDHQIRRQAERVGLNAVRLGARVLGHLSPALSADLILRLAFRVKQYRRPDWEKALLAQADDQVLLPWRDGHLAAWTWGEGPTVALVHGWEGRGTQLGRFIDPLVARGFRVLAFDGPGHGESTASRASLPDQAAALERVAQHVGPLHGVIGHSMGAAAATFAAAQGLAIGRFVLLATPSNPKDYFDEVAKVLRLDDALAQQLIRRSERELDVTLEELGTVENARALRAPALIVHDRSDRAVPLAKGEAVAAAWAGAELMRTDGLGHRRLLKDPAVISRVTDFLTSPAQQS